MLLTIANIAFFLIAVAMIVLILMQRGQGAAAGSGFGAGASATVFGAQGSANFLSRSTSVLAALFMIISLGMATYSNRTNKSVPDAEDLGVMGAMSVPAEVPSSPVLSPSIEVPAVEVPVVEESSTVPAEPATEEAAEPPLQ